MKRIAVTGTARNVKRNWMEIFAIQRNYPAADVAHVVNIE